VNSPVALVYYSNYLLRHIDPNQLLVQAISALIISRHH